MNVISELSNGQSLALEGGMLLTKVFSAKDVKQDAFKPVLVSQFFTPEIHKHIKAYVAAKEFPVEKDSNTFFRESAHSNPYFVHIHSQLAGIASQIFGEPVKPSYVYLSMYGPEGDCPPHTDRPPCKYTIDYCIDQDMEWPIYVEGQEFIMQPNDAVCLSGTDSVHYRNKITGTYCNLAFFHFVPVSYVGPLS